jgi:hypothetical protein
MTGMPVSSAESKDAATVPVKARRWLKSLLPHSARHLYHLSRLVARAGWDRLFWMLHYLGEEQGHFRSCEAGACVAQNGEPIPWYTYPAIEYLRNLDLRDARVFEYGAGNSSLFWAARTKHTHSIEDSPEWYAKVRSGSPPNHTLLLKTEERDYVSAIQEAVTPFDVIIVDGKYRMSCAANAIEHLAPGGFILLDNSDWHPRTAEKLRDAGLIQIDFTGAGPLNAYAWTTSLFLSPGFRPRPRRGDLPGHNVGTLVQVANPE